MATAKYHASPSHGDEHSDLVLDFAAQLQQIYGGDSEVIHAAIMLHDLGRGDGSLHDAASIRRSWDMAGEVLEETGFPDSKREAVLDAIAQHDQPRTRPSSLEARILKDADFLAGFGAWGIVRIAMWAGETGRGFAKVLDRLQNRLLERVKGLEFLESQRLARKDLLFSNLFTSYWQKGPRIASEAYPGKYVILEGVSGSGKDVQAKLLRDCLLNLGHDVVAVSEPGKVYREFKGLWERKHRRRFTDPVLRRLTIMADRHKLIAEYVMPALKKGSIVVSNRSFVSFLVYQGYDQTRGEYDQLEIDELAHLQRFVPVPDIIVLYDLKAEVAMERILHREKKRSPYENLDMLRVMREKYLSFVGESRYCLRAVVINADQPVEKVAYETKKAVDELVLQHPGPR